MVFLLKALLTLAFLPLILTGSAERRQQRKPQLLLASLLCQHLWGQGASSSMAELLYLFLKNCLWLKCEGPIFLLSLMWAAGYGPLKCFLLAHLHVLSLFFPLILPSFSFFPLLISILSIICPFQLRVRFVNFHMLAKTWLAHSSSLPASTRAASHRSKQRGSKSLSWAALTLLGCSSGAEEGIVHFPCQNGSSPLQEHHLARHNWILCCV